MAISISGPSLGTELCQRQQRTMKRDKNTYNLCMNPLSWSLKACISAFDSSLYSNRRS